ncbi:hypothetical protein PMZ80_002925 [Knufia obscura]|uniref:ER lumen protein-retaining receptor n=2 Tax=Knufia TaxID=430999 RepID=A0AAN8ED12_9EURO|nr:hypothetical protein PMZ80_002925 [Knufia obscura]KAK5952488.1 hypothetical protein OHC33_006531 [Knufia fluminis]
MNVFRITGDLSHLASICILIWAIHSNKSAEGVSLVTQVLYLTVFSTRYLDLFWIPPSWNWYNWFFKIFYIFSAVYIILIMTRRYARTREREKAWKLAAYILAFSAVVGPICSLLYMVSYLKKSTSLMEILWAFSIVLESMCVVPQLLLLRQTQVPTVINSGYLVCLGAYRALYILNWIWRSAHDDLPDAISVIFGIIQTALYIDFAWVYYTRQRVKLRGGAVVDSDDLNKGFLVNRFARVRQSEDGDIETASDGEQQSRPRVDNWGRRGVSIRADDTLESHDRVQGRSGAGSSAETEPLTDPDHFLSDDEHDDAPAIDASALSPK